MMDEHRQGNSLPVREKSRVKEGERVVRKEGDRVSGSKQKLRRKKKG